MNTSLRSSGKEPSTAIASDRAGMLTFMPSWITELVGAWDRPPTMVSLPDGACIRILQDDGLALCACTLERASDLGDVALCQRVTQAYLALCESIKSLDAPHLVRLWNFVPQIHAPREAGANTYRVFNHGRYDAFAKFFGGEAAFARQLPTATGIGVKGHDLVIYALSTAAPGTHLENPRQIPAYRYSSRHGLRPPCFARATMVDLPGLGASVLVGGTASVRGEDSLHAGDARAQLNETLINLNATLNAALGPQVEPAPDLLGSCSHLRVYLTEQPEADQARAVLAMRAGPQAQVEIMRAAVCREELLLEIEAVASLAKLREFA